ncbi:type II secretion system F family protein [Janibacter hoylei]|uniref:type II secretion system F family protein n=1 Tax=Janibacter hoylei TaxID=364298 RepID=UPI0021A49D9E|nr:type II secretion system F family protein [Janibacter hoylei]MCT1619531.1 type II secretion system F family protein [Janibacter hoylei]MCT2292534.1 type II secretion system F family protein [Janibacter hoylei]
MTDLLHDIGLARSGAVLGLLLALGLALVHQGLPRHRRATLDDRLAPYLRDTPKPSGLLETDEVSLLAVIPTVLRPLVTDLAQRVESVLGGTSSVRRRLLRAGRAPDTDRFRAEQVVHGFGGAVLGAVLGTAFVTGQGRSPLFLVALVVLGFGIGVVVRDTLLSREADRREARMLAEFPTVAELLALAVGAGEGAAGALERVVRLSDGELSDELGRCLADARAGASLPVALQGLADRTGLTSLARFVDGIVVAVERGTSLAEVLRAQAQDVREEGRRQIMEAGGKKEIAMMVPVVFGVLPVTILFAMFPGLGFFQFQM